MNRKFDLVWLLPLLIFFTGHGCATLISGETQEMTFQSTPDGALVRVNGKPIGKTPLTIQLEKDENQTLVIEKEGFKTFSTELSTKLDGWFWGNIVFGGFFGSTTDSATGAMHEYEPNQYIVTLVPKEKTRLEVHTGKSKSDQLREFILGAYSNIAADAAKRRGPYLDTLLEILEVTPDKREESIKRIGLLTQYHKNIYRFYEQVEKDFLASGGKASEGTQAAVVKKGSVAANLGLVFLPAKVVGDYALHYSPEMIIRQLTAQLKKENNIIAARVDNELPLSIYDNENSEFWNNKEPNSTRIFEALKEKRAKFALIYRVRFSEENNVSLDADADHIVYLFRADTEQRYQASGNGMVGQGWERSVSKSVSKLMRQVQ